MLRKGDKVIIVEGIGKLSVGDECIVVEASEFSARLKRTSDQYLSGAVSYRYLHLSNTSDKKSTLGIKDQWQFEISSEDTINYSLIGADLSYKNPIAFVDLVPICGGHTVHRLVIDSSILTKMHKAKGYKSFIKKLDQYAEFRAFCDGFEVYDLFDERFKSRVVKLMSAIKAAPYRRQYKLRATAQVSIPNVNR